MHLIRKHKLFFPPPGKARNGTYFHEQKKKPSFRSRASSIAESVPSDLLKKSSSIRAIPHHPSLISSTSSASLTTITTTTLSTTTTNTTNIISNSVSNILESSGSLSVYSLPLFGTPDEDHELQEQKSEGEEEDQSTEGVLARTLIRSSQHDIICHVKVGGGTRPKELLKVFKETYPEYAGTSFKFHRSPDLESQLLALELRLMVKGYKFGLLYALSHQTTEDEFFQNQEEGENYKEFMSWLASTIQLKGWSNYLAGLDSERDSTGVTSLYTTHESFEIMFHVSTMLPYTPDDQQQLSRKRHLGNDIVVIIFQEGGNHEPFDPRIIFSYFNHIFFVIRKDEEASSINGETTYQIGIVTKNGVDHFLPPIPKDGLLRKNNESRNWLLTKLINAERASYQAPGFSTAIERTRQQLLNDIMTQYLPHTSSTGWN
eukprot:TRINITY_DN5965_c0_g1_i6.p1 TRINITY_DN5965_c0_g1~~TRINITY_DN5965_c0_g1_i6.p1  ORF type:complete len:431 (+),score=86.44 TRINITY_DN5965_c0_g1_i6:331-1623(+)